MATDTSAPERAEGHAGRAPHDRGALATTRSRARAEQPGLPRRDGRRAGSRSRGRRRPRRVRRARERLPRARDRQGRRGRDPRDDAARVGARRLRARARSARSRAAIYPISTPRDGAYILEHSDAVAVVVEDDAQRAKVDATRERHAARSSTSLSFADLAALEERGRAYAAEHPTALADASAAIDEDDLFTYIYTSGTTGPPKGCMIRHRNYYEMVAVLDELDDFVGRRRRDAALPPARAQLRPADAPRPARTWATRSRSSPTRCGSARRSRTCARRSCRASRASTRRCTPRCARSSTPRPA